MKARAAEAKHRDVVITASPREAQIIYGLLGCCAGYKMWDMYSALGAAIEAAGVSTDVKLDIPSGTIKLDKFRGLLPREE